MALDSEPFDDAPEPVERPSSGNEGLMKYSIDPIPPYKHLGAFNDPVPSHKLAGGINDPVPSYKSAGAINDHVPLYKPVAPFTDVQAPVEPSKEIAVLEKEKEDTFLSRHDSFRTRTNPLIQRGSRLRSSLIFSNSKIEQHTSTAEGTQIVQKEQSTSEVTKGDETTKTSSKVAEILQKYRSVNKDNETTTVTQAKAAATVIEEESANGQKRSTETVAFKSLESKLLDKDSFSRTLLESQYRSLVTSDFEESLSKDKVSSSLTKVEQKITSVLMTEKNLSAFQEKKESGPIITEIVEPPKPAQIEPPKTVNVVSSGLSFGSALEIMSHTPTPVPSTTPTSSVAPVSNVTKSEEEMPKIEQNPMEFIRKGSMRLKQFLQSKAEKKAEEDLSSDAAKVEKQNRRLSKAEISETAPAVDTEDKTTKTMSVSPPKPTSTNQSRLSSSTSNVIFSSNLRDDTKVILEQISANSQKNRAELAKQSSQSSNDSEVTPPSANITETKTEEEPNIESPARSGSFLSRSRFSRPSHTTPEDRDNLLRRMESIRKEKRVYSRFEVFCKKDEQQPQVEEIEDDGKDKKGGKFMPRLLGTLIKK